jgi:PleD family two-component response regulator
MQDTKKADDPGLWGTKRPPAAEGAAAGLLALACREFDLLLADQAMQPLSGLQLLAWAQQRSPYTAALILADPGDAGPVGQALTRGLVDAYLLKPLRAETLLQTLRNATLRRHRRASPRGALRQLHLLAQDVARLEEDRRGVLRYALEMECLALSDPLTGLPNRRAIEEAAAQELARRARHQAPLALGLIDIDHFKEINRRHLLSGGDRTLVAVACTLRASLGRRTGWAGSAERSSWSSPRRPTRAGPQPWQSESERPWGKRRSTSTTSRSP